MSTKEIESLLDEFQLANKDDYIYFAKMLLSYEKGFEIGTKKVDAYFPIIVLLKMLDISPKVSTDKLVYFAEVKKGLVLKLKKAIATKDKKIIHQVIDKRFIKGIKIPKSKQVKINKLVRKLLKKQKKSKLQN